MNLEEAQTYNCGDELDVDPSIPLRDWELHQSCLQIVGVSNDEQFNSLLFKFKKHEMEFTKGLKPSDVNHCEMIKQFVKKL